MFVKSLLDVDDGDDKEVQESVDYKVDDYLFDADECESPSLPNVHQLPRYHLFQLSPVSFSSARRPAEKFREDLVGDQNNQGSEQQQP